MRNCRFLVVFVLLFAFISTHAQEPVPLLLKNGRYSFVKYGTKEILIQKQFDDARPFSNGFALVKLKGKWGGIDNNGEYKIPCEYNTIAQLDGGFYLAQTEEEDGIVFEVYFDRKMDKLDFELLTPFSEGLALAERPSMNSNIASQFFVLDTNRRIYSQVKIDKERVKLGKFGNGLLPIENNGFEENLSNYISLSGKKLLSSCDFNELGNFENGLAKVKRELKFGYIDTTGEEVVPLRFDELGPFSDGLSYATVESSSGYINKLGEIIIPFQENFVGGNFSEGLAFFKKNNKNGYINKKGEVVPMAIFNNQTSYNISSDEFPKFEFSNGLALYYNKGKYGYIDKTGKLIIPNVFSKASKFTNGFAIVYGGPDASTADKFGIIDRTGKFVLGLKYKNILMGTYPSLNNIAPKSNILSSALQKFDFSDETNLEMQIKYFKNNLVLVENLGSIFYVDVNGFEYKEN